MTRHERNQARVIVERALDQATVDVAQAAAQILRSLAGGSDWSTPLVATMRDRYARARRDQAVAKALLAELDERSGGE